jgi:glycosyltransferase involved in cell wall biosynthesis
VIVPCRNEAGYIERFVADVLAQEPVEGGVEVIIADGRSSDGTREALAQLAAADPRVVVIDNPAGTVSHGLNAALGRARGSVIARMDVHTSYATDYLRRCVEVLESSGADNVGGPARTRAIGLVSRAIAIGYASSFAVGGARFHDPDHAGDVDTVPYGCWRKRTLTDLGGFDEALVRNQDDELNLRLRLRGGRIHQSPAIRSWYHPRDSLPALARQYFQYGYWKVRVIRKHGQPASWRHLVPGAAVAAGGALAAASPFSAAALVILAIASATWLLLALAAGVAACRRAGDWAALPLMPAVFATYHAAYGAGFLAGLADAARRRAPAAAMTELTR